MEPGGALARTVMEGLARESQMYSARPDAPVRARRPSRTNALRDLVRRILAWRRPRPAAHPCPPLSGHRPARPLRAAPNPPLR